MRAKIRRKRWLQGAGAGFRQFAEARTLKPGSTGSVVGIQIEAGNMYTGTLIRDLMATVERAERNAKLRLIEDARELERLYSLEISFVQNEPTLVGAA